MARPLHPAKHSTAHSAPRCTPPNGAEPTAGLRGAAAAHAGQHQRGSAAQQAQRDVPGDDAVRLESGGVLAEGARRQLPLCLHAHLHVCVGVGGGACVCARVREGLKHLCFCSVACSQHSLQCWRPVQRPARQRLRNTQGPASVEGRRCWQPTPSPGPHALACPPIHQPTHTHAVPYPSTPYCNCNFMLVRWCIPHPTHYTQAHTHPPPPPTQPHTSNTHHHHPHTNTLTRSVGEATAMPRAPVVSAAAILVVSGMSPCSRGQATPAAGHERRGSKALAQHNFQCTCAAQLSMHLRSTASMHLRKGSAAEGACAKGTQRAARLAANHHR